VWIEVLYSSNPHKTSRSPNSTQNDEEPYFKPGRQDVIEKIKYVFSD